MIKIKVTYLDFNKEVKAKIFNIYSWVNVSSDIMAQGISSDDIILKIEVVMEASEDNIVDSTS